MSTNKNRDERFVDRNGLEEHLEAATQVVLNQTQFEAQNRLIDKALSASVASVADLSNMRIIKPRPVSEVPLPRALAERRTEIGRLSRSLERSGICWISGAAGMGKSIAARIAARKVGGDWASINLRCLTCEQVALILSDAADTISSYGVKGLLIDDLECVLDSQVLENLQYLINAASRLDVLVVCSAPNPPPSDFLFTAALQSDVALTLEEFTEEDIVEILEQMGVSSANWAKYIHLISGGGHPQLAIASIQSMAASGWDPKEFQTFSALLTDSPVIEDVRRRTRERLLIELPDTSRRLIERLSLNVGGFNRDLALDLGKITPPIPDAGIVLDRLTGSWIDQNEGDRFHLSPLLSGFAAKTTSSDDRDTIHSAIANSLTKGRSLNVSDMNSALLAAWSGKNTAVIIKLCAAIFGSNQEELKMLAPHMSMFTMFRTDTIAYPTNAAASQMFRGAQLLLLNQERDSGPKVLEALNCFTDEALNVEDDAISASMNLLVYSKLLLQTSKAGLGTCFTGIIEILDNLLENENGSLPSKFLSEIRKGETDGVTPIGFMFLNQTCQLSNINDLPIIFDFLDNSPAQLRAKLLRPFDHCDFDIDMLVTNAWLSEHKRDTIDPPVHAAVFANLEDQAISWGHTELGVCCRKFQAIILDEYGNDKESALAVLDEGLSRFGLTNSELVRAKVKVLYRSEDHKESLALSKKLIEGDAPLSNVEKAFLGREAAISAERQGDFVTARRYYLYGSNAAQGSKFPNMTAMRVGLLADAALSSWHDGDRKTCLQDFVMVLKELNEFAPDESLRSAHCHAVARHVLLWLNQDVTGEAHLLEDGAETKIYPGCVSNPEPHSEIGTRYITPIEMAWYMLATIENHASLGAGITDNLATFLPNGPVHEGQLLLTAAIMHKAMTCLDAKLFKVALKDTISDLAYLQANGGYKGSFDIKNVTYGRIPSANKMQQDQLSDLTEQFTLLFSSMGILKDEANSITAVLQEIAGSTNFTIRPELLDRLTSVGPSKDFNTDFAQLILAHGLASSEPQRVSPRQVFELAFKTLQMAQRTGTYKLFTVNALPWLEQHWQFVWQKQRFLLNHPNLYESDLKIALDSSDRPAAERIVGLMKAILPTLRINNMQELREILDGMPTE